MTRKMNFSATTGFICCFLIILLGIVTNGGIETVGRFIHVPSMLVTFGGAFFAVMITSDSFGDFFGGLKCFLVVFQKESDTIDEISNQIFQMSGVARKEGLLVLEEKSEKLENPFLKKAIGLIVDGADPELIRDILETEMIHYSEKSKKRIQF